MFANQVFGLVFLAAVMAVVSSEVYAALHALHYAVKQEGSLVRRAAIALARYEWASPLFHETACMAAERKPAYRASLVMAVFGAAAALMAYAGAGMYVVGGAATLAAAGFGCVAYGKAFMAHRTAVREEIAAFIATA